jgi:hypothetical protein
MNVGPRKAATHNMDVMMRIGDAVHNMPQSE